MIRVVAVAALMGACGGGSAMPSDGAGPSTDAAADASIDAPWSVGVITVTARNGDPATPGIHPSAGTSVVFTDATQLTQVMVTDAMGVASASVTGPTTITHVQQLGNTYEATTIVGAMPGDDLLLERVNRNFSALAPIAVSYTSAPNTSYETCTACGCANASASPTMAPMFPYCQSNPANVVLVAYQGTTTTYAYGSTAYDPSAGGAISLVPSTPTQPYTGTFTTLPPEVSRIVFDFICGTNSRAELVGPGSSATLNVRGWQGLPAHFSAYVARSDGAHQTIVEDINAGTTGFALDGATTLLPWLGLATYEPATRTFHAPSLPGAIVPDLFIGTFGYVATSNESVIWTIIANSPGEFVTPEIPTSVADLTPKPDLGSYGSGYAFASDAIAGYAEARRDPFSLWRHAYRGGIGRVITSETPFNSPPYFP